MLESLDAAAVRRWCSSGLAGLRRHQQEIDDLNVYPVPDGDTGTNLVLTLASADRALTEAGTAPQGLPDDSAGASGPASQGPADEGAGAPVAAGHGEALRVLARGALLGARGNSGVIVSQVFRGLADALGPVGEVRGRSLAEGLRVAAEAAYQAVAEPVEGTVLSVAAAAARGAAGADSDDLAAVVRAATEAAALALAQTPRQLPALARAGVVDAGGRGLVVLLEALVEVVTGTAIEPPVAERPAIEPPAAERPAAEPPTAAPAAPGAAGAAMAPGGPMGARAGQPASAPRPVRRETGSAAYAYEVQYLLDADEGAVAHLRQTLAGLGDSLVVVGTGTGETQTWNVHVHVNDVGAAIEAGVAAGRPHRIAVTRFDDMPGTVPGADPTTGTPNAGNPRSDADLSHAGAGHADTDAGHADTDAGHAERDTGRAGHRHPGSGPGGAGRPAYDPDARATVVVAAGDGLAALFRAEGARVVAANPSTAEILAAVRDTGAGRVVVLPNDPNTRGVASAAAAEAAADDIRVRVVPTRSPVQALAALAVRDPVRRFDDDVIAMAEAAGACRYGEVCFASREALTVAGRCRPGDVLGLVAGEVCVIGTELRQTCGELLDRMLGGGGELVTLILGAEAPADLDASLRTRLAATWPFVEAQTYDGGQPFYPLLVGVE